jgi:hypothetical protein
LARKYSPKDAVMTIDTTERLELIGELILTVAAKERERCAKIADDYAAGFGDDSDPLAIHSREIARLIRINQAEETKK